MIKFDPKKKEQTISIGFFGGIRIRYHVMLLSPKGNGEILKEWRGNNWDKEKDEFPIKFTGNNLKFAPLSWQFDIFPNPNIPGEKYRITLNITQEAKTIFLKEYEEQGVSNPKIITEDAVFVPNV
jgi:hypothetical protein